VLRSWVGISTALAAVLLGTPAAVAQNWEDAPGVVRTGPDTLGDRALNGDEYLATFCDAPVTATCGPVGVFGGNTYVRITEFARADRVTALEGEVGRLSAEMSGLRDEILAANQNLVMASEERLRERSDDGAALSGVLDFQMPRDGRSNRVGAQTLAFGESEALGVTYTRAVGDFDLGVGLATTGDRTMSKVGVGFSW